MKKTNKVVLFLGIISGLSACGGSGGDGVSNFAGVWTGSTTLVEDSCGLINPEINYMSFNHLINQDVDKILIDNGAVVFSGELIDDSSFSASLNRSINPVQNHQNCKETVVWRYEQLSRDQAQFVVRKSDIACSDNFKCSFTFTGNAYRYSINPDAPIPVDPGIGGGLLDSDL